MKMDWKEMLRLAGLGVGTVLVTPFLAGLLGSVDFLKTTLPGDITLATAVGAGIAAIAFSYVIDEYTR